MSDNPLNLLGLPAPTALLPEATLPKSQVPTLDEAFPIPTLEEAFPMPKPLYARLPLVEYFNRGFKHGFGQGITEDAKKSLREMGVLGPAETRQQTLIQEFTERYLLGAAEAGYFGIRAIQGTIYGLSEAMAGAGVPRDLTPAAQWEAFPVGHLTGLPRRISPTPSPTMERLLPRDTPPAIDLDAALELGVFGRTPDELAREQLRPSQTVTEAPRSIVEVVEPSPPQITDIHMAARQLDPPTFELFDNLASQKEQYRGWLNELATQKPRALELETQINTILGKVRGIEERLTNRATARLEALRDELVEVQRTDTPEMAVVRRDLIRADEQMRDLAPKVSEAYREARRLMPEEVRTTDIPVVEPTVTRTPRGWEISPLSSAEQAGNVIPLRDPRITALEEQLRTTGNVASSEVQRALGVGYSEASRIRDDLLKANEPAIRSLAQRAPTIARDTEQRLIAAGRPAEVARAEGALIQAHYEARSARFGGALGTARQLYEAEAPRIVGARGAQRGRLILRDARNTIQLMERADASTFMHETAHNWLEELRRDATHEMAPPDLTADLATVKEWLGVEGDAFGRAHHERFARGFERYLMEGQAPSSHLARVFEKFKGWLTQIYQSVARLRAPITDDIRGVYDRLLSTPSRDPVIVPEREGARTWAEDARAAVRETPAAEAAAKADAIAEQREAVARQLRREIDERRREARRGPERTKVPDERDGESKPDFAREAFNATDDDLDAGRTATAGKSEAPTSATERFESGDRPLVDRAGNIRIDNLMVGDDVAEAIRQAAGERSGFIEARRGVLADSETIKLAEALGVDPTKIDRWAVAEAWTAEQIVFARRLLVDSAQRVRDTANAMAAVVNEKTLTDYAMARERHMMIQERVSAVTAEAGRAMRAFRALEGEKDAKIITSLLQSATGKTPAQLRREARLISTLDDPSKVSSALSRARDPTWGDMFVEAWINTLVSGPFTHIVNTATNFGTSATAIAETGAAGMVGKAFELFGRERGVTFGETLDRVHGWGQGSVDGIRAFGSVVLDESKVPLQRSIDTRPMQAIPSKTVNIGGVPIRIGGAQVRLPGRFLAAEDELFKAIAWQQELNVLSRRAAVAEGLEGDALAARINELRSNPTDSMKAAAEQFAEYQTFQQPLGRLGQGFLNFVNSHPLIRLFIPFVRTPINLFKYSAERSPLGFFSRDVLENMSGRNGAQVRDTQIARMAVGNMVAMGVGYLAYQGLISGGGPRDQAAQLTLRMTGWQPYSFRIGDTWISYRRFDPFSNVIGLAADAADLAKYAATDDAEFEKFASMATTAAWRNIFDKMSMRGVTSVAQALIDPDRYGKTFLNGLAASFVPGAISQVARMEDEFDREARTLGDSLRARLPADPIAGSWEGRMGLFPRRDRWGEPVLSTEWGPSQIRAVNADPVNQAMLELGINKAQPPRKVSGVELTGQQYDDYVRISGRLAKEMLNGIVTGQFRELPKGVQVETINSVIDAAREMARGAIMMQGIASDNDIIAKSMELRTKALR